MRAEVVAVRQRRASGAVVERVADHTAPARVGAVDPELQLAVANVAIQIEVADARLDECVCLVFVQIEHLVHALQIEHDAARVHGRGAAIGEVAAGGDRVQRHRVLVRGTHDLLYLLYRFRRYSRGSDAFALFAPERRVRVAVGVHVVVAREYPLRADGIGELFDRFFEVGGADSGRGSHGVFSWRVTRVDSTAPLGSTGIRTEPSAAPLPGVRSAPAGSRTDRRQGRCPLPRRWALRRLC